MKNIIVVFFLLSSNFLFSQNLPNFNDIKLDKAIDYKVADSFVLIAANYLLTTPFNKDDIGRLKSLQFVIKWMSGTPDYTFTLDNAATKIMKESDDLLGIYMAAMSKYCLKNKVASKDTKAITLNAVILLLNYCENDNNNIKMTKQLKKLSEARAKGQLEQAL